jgi:hypothetical protein
VRDRGLPVVGAMGVRRGVEDARRVRVLVGHLRLALCPYLGWRVALRLGLPGSLASARSVTSLPRLLATAVERACRGGRQRRRRRLGACSALGLRRSHAIRGHILAAAHRQEHAHGGLRGDIVRGPSVDGGHEV